MDEYRLQTRGGRGVINVKTTARNGKVSAILLVDDSSELMVISQYGKIIRIDTKTIRAAGRSTQGVRLLHLEDEDKVAAAVVIPPEEAKIRTGKRNAAAVKGEGVPRARYPSSKADWNSPAKLRNPWLAVCFGCLVDAESLVVACELPQLSTWLRPYWGCTIKDILLAHIHGEEARAVFAENRDLGVGARLAVDLGVNANRIVHAVQKIPRFRYWLCCRHRTHEHGRMPYASPCGR